MKYFIFFLLTGFILYSCNSDNPSSSGETPSAYNKLFNAGSGNVNFEFWNATGSNLYYGYNEIGFKVFVNGVEKTDGFVKFNPVMVHFIGQTGHSSPRSTQFNYNSSSKLFTGYVCFNMISDSGSVWLGYYNYNNLNYVDSVPFTVLASTSQMTGWDDIQGGNTYILTLLGPNNPKVGKNDYSCLLHKDIGNNEYAEVDNAIMIITPWMPAHGHGSSSNENPVSQGNGKYMGKVNFSMLGEWDVYDTIKINNALITKPNPPKFNFFAR